MLAAVEKAYREIRRVEDAANRKVRRVVHTVYIRCSAQGRSLPAAARTALSDYELT